MANISPTYQNYNKIKKFIDLSRFNESFLLLKKNMALFPSLSTELEKLKTQEDTYRHMLDYIADGHQDPSLQDMLNQTRESLHRANDLLLRDTILKDSSDIYSSTHRMFVLKQTSLQSLLESYDRLLEEVFKENKDISFSVITQSQERLLQDIFNYVWTMFGSPASEYETLSKVLEDTNYPDYFKSLIISSIILGNLSYFDPDSFELLFNLYETTDSPILKSRVIVGIVLISLLNSKRISGNLKLRSRLMLSVDDELKQVVNDVLINIIRTYDTKRIDNKMRNEVIPGLMKINPEIIDKMRNLASDSENFLSEGNPDWEDMIEQSGIGDKLKEINDLQMEGADVMVTAFSNLKGFPFFSNIPNWFLPFTLGHYEFAALPLSREKNSVEQLTFVMCDSDLHSFLLSLKTMPEDKMNLMLSNMQNQMKEAYEAMSNSIGETENQVLSKKIRHSLQDLYRFFKFFRKKEDFKDPFASPFIAKDIDPLISLYDISLDNVKVVAEFYFKNKYFEEAAGLFELIDKYEPGNFNIWEKIGYCYDKLNLFGKALEWYKKAELLNPGNKWLEKRLAISLKNAGRASESLEYYEKSLSTDPENYHLLMSYGQCLLSCGKYQEAISQFYHANYLKPEKKDALRAVAWTELLSHNYEKADSLYDKLISAEKVDKDDFLNAAHVALAMGNFKKAVNLYKKFIDNSENQDITNLVIAFKNDSETFRELNIKNSDLRLIVDKIRYDRSSDN